jgi:hypothetical protein
VRESDFSSKQELFVKFNYKGKQFNTMVMDGEGKHVKWDSKFMLEIDEQTDSEVVFEACEGSPLDHKVVGKTSSIKVKELASQSEKQQSLKLTNSENEEIGNLQIVSIVVEQAK